MYKRVSSVGQRQVQQILSKLNTLQTGNLFESSGFFIFRAGADEGAWWATAQKKKNNKINYRYLLKIILNMAIYHIHSLNMSDSFHTDSRYYASL